ncbi:MAG: preprotein translocase subunit SecE [Gemmatimonadota bacterium]|nr:preprotein translocase subunit SecE [Gemmatimonadota bacterium]
MSQGEAVTAPGGAAGFLGRSRDFLVAARAELGKVTWPTRDELFKATRMVVIFAVILGLAIGLLDWLLNVILVKGVAQLAQ